MEKNIETVCKEKEQELLDRYFGAAAGAASETIGDYGKDLPLKVEAEYREFLTALWQRFSDEPLVLEEQKLRSLMTEANREEVDAAYDDARRRTLWERLTRSNHRDVAHYRALLRDYAEELLTVMRIDFLEEITGRYITGKAFAD